MPASAPTVRELRDRLARLTSGAGYRPRPAGPAAARRPPAGFEPVETPLGRAWRRADVVPAGGDPLGACYLDTETTGLAGGAGTLVFAVALARPCESSIEILQLFLSEPAGEPALLALLAGELAGWPEVATYNGRAFDLPLLRTRWVMARMPGEFPSPPDLDLLHVTRGLLRHRLTGCSLREVEERLLGFEREDDLPSALVPDAYLRFVREGWSPTLEAALRHNRQDVLSLHHLHRRLAARLDGRDAGMEAADWLALGRYLWRRGRRADGWRALRAAAEMATDETSAMAGILIARKLARRGAAAAAESLLGRLEDRLPEVAELPVARAKLLEWRLRDPAGALRIVERALDRLRPGDPDHDLPRRRARLRARAGRAAARPAAPQVARLPL